MTTINRWIHKWIHIYIHLYSIFTYIYKYFPRISFLTASLNFAGWTPVFFCCVQFEIRNFVSSSLIGSWTRQGGMMLDVDWWTENPFRKTEASLKAKVRRCEANEFLPILCVKKTSCVRGFPWRMAGRKDWSFFFLFSDFVCFRHLLIVINGNLEWEILEIIIAIAFCRSIESQQTSTEIWFVTS